MNLLQYTHTHARKRYSTIIRSISALQVSHAHKKSKGICRTSKAFIRFTNNDDDDDDDDDDDNGDGDDDDDDNDDDDFRAYSGIYEFREREDEQHLRNASHADFSLSAPSD